MTTVTKTEAGPGYEGILYYRLENDFLTMEVTNLGCRILRLFAADREGRKEDVVLSYADIKDCHSENSMMGAVVGRVANRIGYGQFTLNGRLYKLAVNCGAHHLHGGLCGFDRKIFDSEITDQGISFRYSSADMEEGYPGRLSLTVTYRLISNEVHIRYKAVSDQDTILNITNHTYFNLTAMKDNILGHRLTIDADRIACVNDQGLVEGDFLHVAGTPFDFQTPHEIGERINDDHIQLTNAGGYDHPFLLNRRDPGHPAITLSDPVSGRRLQIRTDMPTVQVYTANFLEGGCRGKGGFPYRNRDGVALETQFLSNSINVEENPPVILRAGQTFESGTDWIFDTI